MSRLQDDPIYLASPASTSRIGKRQSQGIGTPISAILGTAALAFSVGAQAAACNAGGKFPSDQAVTVTAGEPDLVCGGFGYSDDEVSRNTVTISGGTAEYVYGGTNSNGNGNANDNTVTISGGTVGFVYGGRSHSGSVNNNTVIISGGTVTGAIYGGFSSSGSANNNRVIIKGAPSIAFDTTLLGGRSGTGAGASGNVLEIWTRGITAGPVIGFDEYHFLLPADTVAGDTILSLKYANDLSNARIGVAMQGGSSPLALGDSITLIHSSGGLAAPTDMQPLDADQMQDQRGNSYLQQGVSLGYQFSLNADAQNLYAVLKSAPRVLDQTKAPVEGIMSGVVMTQNAGDLAAGSGTANAVSAVQGASGVASFGATSGGSSRYNTGSHVDVKDWNLMLGLAKRFDNRVGALTAGTFIEAGWGSYDTYNDFSGGNSVRGNGHTRYVGGGVLARQDWESGLYVEGSLRGGRISSNWGSNQMAGADHASYDTSTTYFGAHVGVGTVIQLSPRLSLDPSAKYFWTHQNGSDAVIAGDPYQFDAVDSQTTRLGVRATYAYTDQFAVYTGAAWNYEFDGAAHATVYGMSTAAPSLKGSTGIFELGVRLQPKAEKSALTLDVGLQGYIGKREGMSGTLKAAWAF